MQSFIKQCSDYKNWIKSINCTLLVLADIEGKFHWKSDSSHIPVFWSSQSLTMSNLCLYKKYWTVCYAQLFPSAGSHQVFEVYKHPQGKRDSRKIHPNFFYQLLFIVKCFAPRRAFQMSFRQQWVLFSLCCHFCTQIFLRYAFLRFCQESRLLLTLVYFLILRCAFYLSITMSIDPGQTCKSVFVLKNFFGCINKRKLYRYLPCS